MTLTADELVNEMLMLIAEEKYYDSQSLRAFSDMPLLQREIVTDSLYHALPLDKQQTIESRLRCIVKHWDKVAAE